MVQNTLNTGFNTSLGLSNTGTASSGGGPNTDSTLTPTTLKSITQLFESQDCLNNLQKIEDEGTFVAPLPVTASSATSTKSSGAVTARRSFFNLDSNGWQGGTTTVVTPTTSGPMTILGLPDPVTTVERTKAPFSSDTKLTMKTRSTTREQTVYTVKRQQKQEQTQQQPQQEQRPQKKSARRAAGRLATNRISEDDLTPDEAARLKIRRERNKAAAARCRKRRVDQIESLSAEVGQWEGKKRILEETIAQLRSQKNELEYILSQHQSECKLGGLATYNGIELGQPQTTMGYVPATVLNLPVAVKSEPVIVEPVEQIYLVHQQQQQPIQEQRHQQLPAPSSSSVVSKPRRPLSLKIDRPLPRPTVEGVEIETPSNVIPSLGFDTLMTSTGLTPTSNIITPVSFSNFTSPTCSSQQRSSEMTSTVELNTPCGETVSLVSL